MTGFYQLARNIAGDVESFCYGTALRDQARHFVGRPKEQAFRQFFNLYAKDQFHAPDRSICERTATNLSVCAIR